MGTTLLAGFKSEIEIYDHDLIVVSLSGISHSALCLNIEVQHIGLAYFILFTFEQGPRNELFSGEARKLPPSYIQDAKNFSVVKPLNSASLASPVPPPLLLHNDM